MRVSDQDAAGNVIARGFTDACAAIEDRGLAVVRLESRRVRFVHRPPAPLVAMGPEMGHRRPRAASRSMITHRHRPQVT